MSFPPESFPVKAVIFDWAGTMVDFGCRAPVAAMAAVFASRGVEVDEALIRADMGRAKGDHIRALLAEREPGRGAGAGGDHHQPHAGRRRVDQHRAA